MGGAVGGRAPADGPADARPGEAPCAAAFVPGRARSRSAARSTAALLALAIALLAGRALPGAAAQAAQGRAKQLPKCATVTESSQTCVVKSSNFFFLDVEVGVTGYKADGPLPVGLGPVTLILKDPIVTVQKDGEAAYELSPKRFAKQNAVTFGGAVYANSHKLIKLTSFYSALVADTYEASVRRETYKKSKKTGTEKLRCKLGGLDADFVDAVPRPGKVPCKMEFRTPCDE